MILSKSWSQGMKNFSLLAILPFNKKSIFKSSKLLLPDCYLKDNVNAWNAPCHSWNDCIWLLLLILVCKEGYQKVNGTCELRAENSTCNGITEVPDLGNSGCSRCTNISFTCRIPHESLRECQPLFPNTFNKVLCMSAYSYSINTLLSFQNVLLDIIEMVMTVKCALDFQ